jgi:hypothetical protein
MEIALNKKNQILELCLVSINNLILSIHNFKTYESNVATLSAMNKIDKALKFINELKSKDSLVEVLKNLEHWRIIYRLIDSIYQNFSIVIDAGYALDTSFTKIYNKEINASFKKLGLLHNTFKKNIFSLDIIINNEITQYLYINIKEQKNPIDAYIILNQEFIQYKYIWDIYKIVANKLLNHFAVDPDISARILQINEDNKNRILSVESDTKLANKLNKPNKSPKLEDFNPRFKNYSLVPVSKLTSLNEIYKLIFEKIIDSNVILGSGANTKPITITAFEKYCRNKHDLIVITKFLNKGIDYDILDLMDYNKSKKYNLIWNDGDGLLKDTVNRFDNIKYCTSNQTSKSQKYEKFKISYNYVYKSESNDTVIILEELYPDQYHVLSNHFTYNQKFFIKKNNIKEFLNSSYFGEFSTNTNTNDRISNYNHILNDKIIKNMFSDVKYNLENLQTKAEVNPKYLRNKIYLAIMEKYKKILGKKILSLITFGEIMHNQEIIQIFLDILTDAYCEELFKVTDIGSRSEIYTSFLYNINLYERDFKKQIHDNFTIELDDFLTENKIVTFKDIIDVNKKLTQIFDKVILVSLEASITNAYNIFQSLIYKKSLLVLHNIV